MGFMVGVGSQGNGVRIHQPIEGNILRPHAGGNEEKSGGTSNRQNYMKTGPNAFLTFHGDLAFVSIHDVFDDF
jgi:hypothetical protein